VSFLKDATCIAIVFLKKLWLVLCGLKSHDDVGIEKTVMEIKVDGRR
jgi:hypothetical protein